MTIKSENPLPRYASGQKSMTDNAKTISPPQKIFRRGILNGKILVDCTEGAHAKLALLYGKFMFALLFHPTRCQTINFQYNANR